MTTIIYEISEFSKIGKYDPSGGKYGHIVRMPLKLMCIAVQDVLMYTHGAAAWFMQARSVKYVFD